MIRLEGGFFRGEGPSFSTRFVVLNSLFCCPSNVYANDAIATREFLGAPRSVDAVALPAGNSRTLVGERGTYRWAATEPARDARRGERTTRNDGQCHCDEGLHIGLTSNCGCKTHRHDFSTSLGQGAWLEAGGPEFSKSKLPCDYRDRARLAQPRSSGRHEQKYSDFFAMYG